MENETDVSAKFDALEDFIQGLFSIQKQINQLKESEANWKTKFERLQQCYTEFKTIIENIPLKITIKDKHLLYTFCNPHFLQNPNIIKDYYGKTDFDLYPEEIAQKNIADDKRVIDKGKPETLEQKYVLKGDEVYLRKIKAPIINDKNQIMGIVEISDDIAGEKLMEVFKKDLEQQKLKSNVLEASLHETKDYFAALLETAPIGLWIFEDDKIKFVNSKGAEILGYSKEILALKDSKEIIALDNINNRVETDDGNNNNTTNYEKPILPFIHKDGTIKLISAKTFMIQYENKCQMAIYGIDCTDDKEIKENFTNSLKHIQSIVNSMETSFQGIVLQAKLVKVT